MGAEQILPRADRAVAVIAAALAAVLAAPAAARAGNDESIVIVDLRPGTSDDRRASRKAFAELVGGVQGLELVDDVELTAALAGELDDDVDLRAAAALDLAGTAFGSLDCPAAVTAATDAVSLYGELEARGGSFAAELTDAYVYTLLCSHRQGDAGRAARVASRLRRLGVDAAPSGVSDAIWAQYPALDARTNVAVVELTIESEPAGATVWVDHVSAGPAPATILVAEGEHLVAVSSAAGSTTQRVTATGMSSSATLAIRAAPTRWKELADAVGSWRRGETPATAVEIGELLGIAGVRFAIVLSGATLVEIWGVRPDAKFARRYGSGVIDDPFAIGVAIISRVEQWEGRSPDPNLPLLVEDPNMIEAPAVKKPQRWWVYASIIGSVVVGAAIVMANDMADDHQKIELTWP